MLRSYRWSLIFPKEFNNTKYGFCYWLGMYFPLYTENRYIKNYIELYNYAFRLDLCGSYTSYGSYWWERGALRPRIKALKIAIKEVKLLL